MDNVIHTKKTIQGTRRESIYIYYKMGILNIHSIFIEVFYNRHDIYELYTHTRGKNRMVD